MLIPVRLPTQGHVRKYKYMDVQSGRVREIKQGRYLGGDAGLVMVVVGQSAIPPPLALRDEGGRPPLIGPPRDLGSNLTLFCSRALQPPRAHESRLQLIGRDECVCYKYSQDRRKYAHTIHRVNN